MKTTSFIAALLASAALAACGGGDDQAADPAESTDSGATETETSVETSTETSSDAMDGGTDMGAEESMTEPEPEPAPAEPGSSDTASAEGADMSADAGAEFMVAGLTGDAENGRRVFSRCRSCHVLEEGVNRVGPSLYGIFGREAGSVEGFRYSEANANSGITWTKETMFEYLENPREYIPGTNMAFPGLRDEQDRADILAYISANGGDAS